MILDQINMIIWECTGRVGIDRDGPFRDSDGGGHRDDETCDRMKDRHSA